MVGNRAKENKGTVRTQHMLMRKTAIFLTVAGKIYRFQRQICEFLRLAKATWANMGNKIPPNFWFQWTFCWTMTQRQLKDWFKYREADLWKDKAGDGGGWGVRLARKEIGQKWDGKQLREPAVRASCSWGLGGKDGGIQRHLEKPGRMVGVQIKLTETRREGRGGGGGERTERRSMAHSV